jgi:hypothetical protein
MEIRSLEKESDELLVKAVLRLDSLILGVIFGVVSAAGLFVATIWLTLKGGANVGQHLGLLGQYFPGYSVTFLGSLVGIPYAFLCGLVIGAAIAWLYNGILWLKYGRRR